MKMRMLTLSGEIGSGKSSVARALVAILPGWRILNTGQLFRDYCTARGLSIQQVGALPDDVHRDFDRHQRDLLLTEMQLVLEGRLAGWLARDLDDVLRVYCDAPLEVRVQRYAAREGCPAELALRDIQHRDGHDLTRYRSLYGVEDYRDRAFYNTVIDTSRFTPDQIAVMLHEELAGAPSRA
jgi:CMP/dCMP kinase